MKARALFIGRWQPFHYGHFWLIKQKLEEGTPVLVAVRDIAPDEKNPFTTTQTIEMIQKVFATDDVQIIKIPDIESVNYGRGVGYKIIEHVPPESVKIISATQIRNSIRNADDAWKETVPPQIHEEVLHYLGNEPFEIAPKVYWFFGLSGSGKTTLANKLREKLHQKGTPVITLDGDEVRSGLNKDLGFTEADRNENIRRIAHTAKLFNTKGFTVIISAITPKESLRELAKLVIGPNFIPVFVKCPLNVCEQRDPKGLYKKARDGVIKQFTGVSDGFEESTTAIVIPTDVQTPDQCIELLYSITNNKKSLK